MSVGFPGSSAGKESACNAGDRSLIPGSGRSPGEGIGSHFSILAWRIPMDRGAWQVSVHGFAESDTTEAAEQAHTQNTRRLFASGG